MTYTMKLVGAEIFAVFNYRLCIQERYLCNVRQADPGCEGL